MEVKVVLKLRVGSEVSTAVKMKHYGLVGYALCSFVSGYQHFRVKCCLHLQVRVMAFEKRALRTTGLLGTARRDNRRMYKIA
jgi:hypothetical protein